MAQESARREARHEGARYQERPVTFSFPSPVDLITPADIIK